MADAVFKTQKKAIRIIFNLIKRESCKTTFKQNNLLTFHSLYIFETLVLTYQHKNQLKTTGDFHSIPTRHGGEVLSYPVHRTRFFEKSPVYAGIKLFNNLPQFIKKQPTLSKFKHNLYYHLINNTFYSVKEFLEFRE